MVEQIWMNASIMDRRVHRMHAVRTHMAHSGVFVRKDLLRTNTPALTMRVHVKVGIFNGCLY